MHMSAHLPFQLGQYMLWISLLIRLCSFSSTVTTSLYSMPSLKAYRRDVVTVWSSSTFSLLTAVSFTLSLDCALDPWDPWLCGSPDSVFFWSISLRTRHGTELPSYCPVDAKLCSWLYHRFRRSIHHVQIVTESHKRLGTHFVDIRFISAFNFPEDLDPRVTLWSKYSSALVLLLKWRWLISTCQYNTLWWNLT